MESVIEMVTKFVNVDLNLEKIQASINRYNNNLDIERPILQGLRTLLGPKYTPTPVVWEMGNPISHAKLLKSDRVLIELPLKLQGQQSSLMEVIVDNGFGIHLDQAHLQVLRETFREKLGTHELFHRNLVWTVEKELEAESSLRDSDFAIAFIQAISKEFIPSVITMWNYLPRWNNLMREGMSAERDGIYFTGIVKWECGDAEVVALRVVCHWNCLTHELASCIGVPILRGGR